MTRDFDQVWTKLFGFRRGEIVKYSSYPSAVWRVEGIDSGWLVLERIAPSEFEWIPNRVNIYLETLSPSKIKKISSVETAQGTQ